MASLGSRLSHAWNAFKNQDSIAKESTQVVPFYGGYGYRPDRLVFRLGTERSIIASIYNRIGMDVASIAIRHVRVDKNEQYAERVNSGLDRCLNISANIDQTGRAFLQDVVMSLCDEGCVAIVPIDTNLDPKTGSYTIESMRVGKIVQWYPDTVKVSLYNEAVGNKQDILVPKKICAIVENPLYSIMNEPNSTLKRLVYKLNLLDAIDEQLGSGKLDIIIQVPYAIRGEAKRQYANTRQKDIEMQLSGSKYGVAYIDGSEHVTQLNRPAENNMMTQIEYLTNMLYGQLGMSEAVFNGTASEEEMQNYYNRTIEPIVSAIVDEMTRKFITKTAYSQGQRLMFFRNPFKLIPVSKLADVADKFTRNEILAPNELRPIVGYKPSSDEKANELRNRNIAQSKSSGEDVASATAEESKKEPEKD